MHVLAFMPRSLRIKPTRQNFVKRASGHGLTADEWHGQAWKARELRHALQSRQGRFRKQHRRNA